MTTSLVNHQPPEMFSYEWTDLVKKTVAKEATDAELGLFLYQCKKTGLDPLAKQIYFQKRSGQIVIITGIDGYRLSAQRTGNYAGSDDAVFDDEANPGKATITVYRLVGGIRCGFIASARWAEYFPGEKQGHMWRKMPTTMLAKCAEALALRKAFPQELGGTYIKEEMDQAGPPASTITTTEVIEVDKRPPLAPKVPVYNGSAEQQRFVMKRLKERGVPQELWHQIDDQLLGHPSSELDVIIERVKSMPAETRQ